MTTDSSTWSAPGRVTLVGDHTDHDGGLALPFAIARRTTVRVQRRSGRTVRVRSAGYDGVVDVDLEDRSSPLTGWGRHVAAVLRVLREEGVPVPGAAVSVRSDVPPGAGLSSSHALLVATASAVLDLAGRERSAAELALLVQRAENEHVGTPSGLLDQTTLLHATAGHLLLVDAGGSTTSRTPSVDQVPWDAGAAQVSLVVVDCGSPHALDDGAYAALRADVERAAARLGVPTVRSLLDEVGETEAVDRLDAVLPDDDVARRRARHVLTENARVREAVSLCRAGRLAEVGPLLTASQTSQRVDLRNSVPAVDTAVAALLDAGALGARMTGGGFGGSVVAIVPVGAEEDCRAAVSRAHDRAGLPAPRTIGVQPSAGARREGP